MAVAVAVVAVGAHSAIWAAVSASVEGDVVAASEATVLAGGDAPDPHVIRVGGTYFAYTTMNGWTSVPVWRSSDLKTWTFVGDAMPQTPSWAEWAYTWAPGVLVDGDRYQLYFTARDAASQRQCIGVVDADRPEGPFTPRRDGPMVCQADDGGSIDPYPFLDSDGVRYLYWKLDANAVGKPCSIWGARLTDDGHDLATAPVRLLDQDRPWEQPTIENPAMARFVDQHLLFYSGGWWESASYGIGYATCEGPLGPCTKQTTAAAWLTRVYVLVGIGGASFVTTETGQPLLAAHAWLYPEVGYAAGGSRTLFVTPVLFGDGPPVVVGGDTVVAIAAAREDGYRLATSGGHVSVVGEAAFAGDAGNLGLVRPIVGMASTPTGAGDGYWLVASDGGVFGFGDAGFHGSLGGRSLNRPIVSMASTPSGDGYWLVASDGGVFGFGDADFHGSLGGRSLNRPIVSMASTPSGDGYWLVASDGGVFGFGDADFHGCAAEQHVDDVRDVIGSGDGYSLVTSDGLVLRYGADS